MNEILSQSTYYIIPLLIVALAGLFSEKSGTVNIALEGMMLIGAFSGLLFINVMQTFSIWVNHPHWILLVGLLISGVSASLFSALLGFLAIKMRADQTIGGTALNLFATALVAYLTIFSMRKIHNQTTYDIAFKQLPFRFSVPYLKDIPILGPLLFNNMFLTTYVGVIILIITIVIFKYTRFGLRLSACGEHPQAAQSAGINVIKYRWYGVLISGFLAGIGGLTYILPTSVSYSGTVHGYGFLALAVLIFGAWKPIRVFWVAIFFGLLKTLSVYYISYNWMLDFINMFPNVPFAMLLRMLPYLATLVALAITSKKSRSPKASGIPFDPLAG
jgi:simple sugar transport system permease protein